MSERDDDGAVLQEGDFVSFTFGIPPTRVVAQLYAKDGALWIHCIWPEDVKPQREKLSRVKKWYQVWKMPALTPKP
ncbi:MAG: hypothetical protein JNN06_03980 [Gemmobacter sp.]|uniref:hypothetical protein n=1 Tax=Gemmobacter sp. TaxID=1898957 RepID=UPI001A44ADC7|nr:hypothetical protein [Gemmobacter sp.]MBL8561419.1 hypothetical protein [Gemmobacter sp.]